MKIVSACLAGVKCRYDGESQPCDKILELVRNGEAIPVCPEQLGGLPTPRAQAEQQGAKVITKDGVDVTNEFHRGAIEVLNLAKLAGCKEAILKSKSPSCGSGIVYDGTFSGILIEGDGVLARLLKGNGIKVLRDDEI
jgi:Uncharacterized conserved protein